MAVAAFACLSMIQCTVASGRVVQQSCTSGSADYGQFARDCDRLGREHLMLQMHAASAVTQSHGLSSRSMQQLAAEHMRRLYSSPTQVAEALRRGIAAFQRALSTLTATVLDINATFAVFGTDLLRSIETLLPEDLRASQIFRNFTADWMDTLLWLPDARGYRAEVEDLVKDADVSKLVRVLTRTLNELSELATSELGEAGFEVAKYLMSLGDVLEGTGEGFGFVEGGEQVEGIKAVFAGLQLAVDSLIPQDLQTSTTYQEVADQTEKELGGMVDMFLSFARRLVASSVCWKRSVSRARTGPKDCDEGHHLVFNMWCMPDGKVGMLRRARCTFENDLHGSWCYGPCAPGYAPFNQHCKQICLGKYYVSSPLICGSTEGSIALSITNMVAKTVLTAATQQDLAIVVAGAGFVVASSMTSVLQAFADFAKPFGYPACDEFLPAVNHAVDFLPAITPSPTRHCNGSAQGWCWTPKSEQLRIC